MTLHEQREAAVQQIVAWAEARDPFWGRAVPRANREAALRQMSDDELRREWRWAKRYCGPLSETDTDKAMQEARAAAKGKLLDPPAPFNPNRGR